MRSDIIYRQIQAASVCLIISMISFFLLFLNTDPALLLPSEAEMEDIAIFKKQMGLDRPVIVQYLDFLEVNQKTLDSYTVAREVIRI